MEDFNPGRFSIAKSLIDTDPEAVLVVMGRSIIIRAELLYHTAVFEYVALSKDFEPCPDGVEPPRYEWVFTDEHDEESGERIGVTAQARRL